MKKLIPAITIILIVIITSCGTLKKNSGHSKEAIMKADAYALSEASCKYRLTKMMHLDSISDVQLKNAQNDLHQSLLKLKRKFHEKYKEPQSDYIQFQKFGKTAIRELSTCKKLQEYEAAKKVDTENPKKSDNPFNQ